MTRPLSVSKTIRRLESFGEPDFTDRYWPDGMYLRGVAVTRPAYAAFRRDTLIDDLDPCVGLDASAVDIESRYDTSRKHDHDAGWHRTGPNVATFGRSVDGDIAIPMPSRSLQSHVNGELVESL